jgi:AcrR family transcriptional regulator
VTTAPVADGRAARKAATRDAIADALLDLLSEDQLRPTAREIAARAGLSLRSVYVHFDDLEDLFCVAARRHFTRIAPMLEPVPVAGTLPERATALMIRRAGIYAQLGGVGRATRLQAPFSPTLARLVRDAQTGSRKEIERMFAPELASLDPARRAPTVAMLDVVTGVDAWETLRTVHEFDEAAARACVVATVVRELAG